MPRQAGFQLENNFTKGLITEATGLNFPENACTETFDCVFSEKGRVTRRLGFKKETSPTNEVINLTDSVFVEFLWKSAGGSGSNNIVVVQVGSTLLFYEASNDVSLSGSKYSHETDLLDFEVGTSTDVKGNICQFASGNGFLFVVHPLCEPFYIDFDPAGPTFTEAQITIKTRDFEGDTTDTDYNNISTRPAALSDAHEYNLHNQGWADDVKNEGGAVANPITTWDAARSDFPSMADVWWYYRAATNNGFEVGEVDKFALGNTPAPKGHFILDDFDTNRSGFAGIGTVTERDSNGRRPTTVAFFASRVWYSGVEANEYNQKIYFSQIIDSTENFGKCYQLNDPTSSEIFDLLPTDGGVIVIPDVGRIVKLFPMANSLLVFAENGIWSIGGSEGVGFKATDYAIRRLSSVETISPLSFVDVYGIPIWWNYDGIYTLGGNEILGEEKVSSISDGSIKAFLLDILNTNKPYIKGQFNPRTQVVQWLYRSTEAADIEESYTYDRILNLNVLSNAFYPWTISQGDTAPLVHGFIVSRGPASETARTLVEDGDGDLVVDSNGDFVYINAISEVETTQSFRYFITNTIDADEWNATWAQTINGDYLDWPETEDLDYESYFISGYKNHGDAIRFFENNYLTITMTTEENSSALFQALWDYSNSPSSARYTNPQQVYISRSLRDIQQTRKKVRGRGRSLQFKFYSETGKPFTIHGWSAWETQNASV